MKLYIAIISVIVVSLAIVYASMQSTTQSIRIGYLANINNAQALVAIEKGSFEKALPDQALEYKIFNTGPEAIEALLTNKIDITYVGPMPAIHGYVRTEGRALKVIAGAASGGSLFVVKDSGIENVSDLAGKRLSTPEYGNTQDVSLRSYIAENGLRTAEYGGNVYIISTKPSEILILLSKGDLDGAWVPEPWGSIILKNTNSKIFLDERDLWPDRTFAATLLVARVGFMEEHPEIVKEILKVHVNTTKWINEHRDETEDLIKIHLERLTGKRFDDDIIHDSLSRLDFTYDPMLYSLQKFAERAYDLNMIRNSDISGIYDPAFLNDIR